MIHIDGSYGEGGGQILRTSVALSAVTGEAVHITDIRSNRPKPGLSAQHVKAIETAALICGATVEGVSIGSTNITFSPQEVRGGYYTIDIGTAGSIALLLQCIMPAAAYSDTDIELNIIGGTDVSWAPSIDYLENVTLKALSKMGYRCEIDTRKRGYYPRGGGVVHATISPSEPEPHDFTEETGDILGISHCSNLPEHVAKRQADSAKDIIGKAGYDCHIITECAEYPSTGSGITLYCGMKGAYVPGKRGLPAEKVGSRAAAELLDELSNRSSVDVHLADQLIPYMGLAKGGSFTVREISSHTTTNIWVTEQFLDVKFKIQKKGNMMEILAI
ncbi:RNA 3'-terminal phosphate cyclase (ATP) [Methanococcoides vulcani]|uniref:RNA 3'-terminal phosphate cyclase n=1 Tax=Methanococcoides vulcani TaxID=1353158 RepID=A0A1I0AVS5_9EURY|nr:RNA 3'-terminal phosphate cyclase [Methanococcoides vulcani]SES98302.1 RNA 3'-terminal phosphate cyclase (ATP) [Methanococcoides vulcani]